MYRTEPESAQSIKKAGVKREDVFVTTKSRLTLSSSHNDSADTEQSLTTAVCLAFRDETSTEAAQRRNVPPRTSDEASPNPSTVSASSQT